MIKHQGIITLLSSVSHIGETVGIEALFNRMKIMMPDSSIEQVPVINGNAMRGMLRDASAAHLCDLLDLQALPLPSFYLLFSGGALTTSGATLNLEQARHIRHLLPSLALFGGGAGNHILAGNLQVGQLLPIALETAHLLPHLDLNPTQLQSVYEFVQTTAYTRRDDAKQEAYQAYITEEVQQAVNAKAKKQLAGELVVQDKEPPAQQMRYFVETLSAGVKLYWQVAVLSDDPLQAGAFYAALARWAQNPVIGGKSAVGHGQVQIELNPDILITPFTCQLPIPLIKAYEQHLLDNAEAIRQALYV